jgi:magnesium transporter
MVEIPMDVASLVRAGDFARLREELTHWRPQELATTLAALRADDQVIAFRILPRRLAASVFEYLSADQQRALVKAMGQEDVAALLNRMSPDDRTLFFSELPANVTRPLLALLTPEERREAVTLLGYAPGTVGRLMTPHYIAVREDWTVGQVLDYVRQHGQDSETLNVIYVIDEAGVLIDDIRIREFLVVPLTRRVSELMDRRYVTLKATDTQQSAVEVFRREDRTALPVTDTTGVLIGIVTVDDVLDVAEEAATREFQLFGGSGPAVLGHVAPADGEKTGRMARRAVPRGDADGDRDGLLREGDCKSGRVGAFRPTHHLERWEFRFASVNPRHSRACLGRTQVG